MGRLSGHGLPSILGKPAKLIDEPEGQELGSRRSVNWYNTWRWQQLRKKIIKRDNRICQQTGAYLNGKYPAGDSAVVDHRIPHRGDEELFWDESNLQTVSKEYHDRVKQSLEKQGLA